jgi:hypothetical protein
MKAQRTRTYGTQQRQSKEERTERYQISDLILHLKLLEKQKQAKPKPSRRREIINIRTKTNEIETKKTIQRINETKS